MKKFLKVFIIVILVIAAVAGTVVLFFINRDKNDSVTGSIADFVYSDDNKLFNSNLQDMNKWVNSDSTDNRVELIIKTNNMMDEIVKDLSSYHIANNTQIDNEKIFRVFNGVVAAKNLLGNMMSEYKIKKDSTYFNRHVGANDFYNQACVYLVNYAEFANYINTYLGVNRQVDLKFTMFEVYCNVVMTTFNTTKTENSKVVVESTSNINKINQVMVVENSFIDTSVNQFAIEISQFNSAYYTCNKVEFAKNLASNISAVSSVNQDTNEKIATYYFKQIFGI